MSLRRTAFLTHLVLRIHIEDPESGMCLRCRPPDLHPCRIRRRVIGELVRSGALEPGDTEHALWGRWERTSLAAEPETP